jgi:hypothetical protein
MKRLRSVIAATLILIPLFGYGANTYYEFFARSGGNNMNGGALNSGAEPSTTAIYSSTNGNWNTSTFVYTPTDGSTPASTLTVGDACQVFNDGSTTPVWIGRVTVIAAGANGAITFGSNTGRVGSAPTTSATARSINCGGSWVGPSGTSYLPASLLSGSILSANGGQCRVNLKNDQQYNMTATPATVNMGSVTIQGYTGSAGDGGKATIDGGTSGAAYILFNCTGTGTILRDLIFAHNGATSNASLTQLSGGQVLVERCVAHDTRGNGWDATNGTKTFVEDEAYACNGSNTTGAGGFQLDGSNTTYTRCIAHDNTGSASSGFIGTGSNISFYFCISDTNGKAGFESTGASGINLFQGCDAYNNTTDGFLIGNVTTFNRLENCNAVKNTGWGINTSNVSGVLIVYNCGFGSGSMANGNGTINYQTKQVAAETATVTYTSGVTPWVDPANGDFRINSTQALGAGRGVFTETATSYTGAVGFPDIGAAQSLTGPGGTFSKEVSGGNAQ